MPTLFDAPLLRATLLRLAFHDVAADNRKKLPHCLELQDAILVLGGKPTEYGSWNEMLPPKEAA